MSTADSSPDGQPDNQRQMSPYPTAVDRPANDTWQWTNSSDNDRDGLLSQECSGEVHVVGRKLGSVADAHLKAVPGQ